MAVTTVLTVVMLAMQGCGASAPALPSDKSPIVIHQLLTGQDSTEFLSSISTYPWDDDGVSAADLFSWIATDAASPDAPTAARAGEAAHALAMYLSDNEGALLGISSGFLNRDSITVGALNPALVDAYANALIPFQGLMVCDQRDPRGFEMLDAHCEASVLAARPVFAVLSSDPAGFTEFADAAQSRANEYLVRFAANDPTGVNNPTPAALAYIGRLLGLTTAGALRLPNSSLHPPDIDAEIVEVKYVLADSFLARTPALGFAAKYVADGKLMSPEDVRDQFGEGGYYDYTRHLEVFLQEAGNINSLVEHEVRGQYEFAAGAAAQ